MIETASCTSPNLFLLHTLIVELIVCKCLTAASRGSYGSQQYATVDLQKLIYALQGKVSLDCFMANQFTDGVPVC